MSEPSVSELENAPILELPRLKHEKEVGTVLTVQDAGSTYLPNAGGFDVVYYIQDMNGSLYRVPRTARVIQAWIRAYSPMLRHDRYEFGILPNGNDYAEFIGKV